ncbi:hypothetical protein [Limnohabitans sp.]|uniref:hypothetical protein n=1 Tax=Limnohabitans sp. TaxID=1907725 RepID=UPI00286ECAFB|nr:hypothetical protein [Limnohabitans sp.]
MDCLCEADRLGRKTGAGYYTYVESKQQPATDAVVRHIIEDASQRRRIQRQALSSATIQRRALLAIVNEAACLMAEGVTNRASDIDVLLVHGYGFPRWDGGPVFWARQQNHEALTQEIRDMARQCGAGFFWQISRSCFKRNDLASTAPRPSLCLTYCLSNAGGL